MVLVQVVSVARNQSLNLNQRSQFGEVELMVWTFSCAQVRKMEVTVVFERCLLILRLRNMHDLDCGEGWNDMVRGKVPAGKNPLELLPAEALHVADDVSFLTETCSVVAVDTPCRVEHHIAVHKSCLPSFRRHFSSLLDWSNTLLTVY